VLVVVLALAVNAWGPIGHGTIGALVDVALDQGTRSAILKFLNDDRSGESISAASLWADTVDHGGEFDWNKPLHYVNTPDFQCSVSYKANCPRDFCVIGAIANYTGRLADTSLGEEYRIRAVKWLLHYIQDIHQPMHVSFETDRGGNSFKGTFMGRSTNLHSLWDTAVIDDVMKQNYGGNQQSLTDALATQYKSYDFSGVSTCKLGDDMKSCVTKWATESASLACKYAYTDPSTGQKVKNGFNLGSGYFDTASQIVPEQFLKASYRLTTLLESIFSSA